jgi:hypothetical protein
VLPHKICPKTIILVSPFSLGINLKLTKPIPRNQNENIFTGKTLAIIFADFWNTNAAGLCNDVQHYFQGDA